MRTKGGAGGRPSLNLAIPDRAGYEALQSMLTGEYTEESTGARTIRQSGGKDRHSKVFTSRGPRDRRVRLSVSTAIRFYDLQDRLGLEQPSKAVEWLLLHCQPSIKALPRLGSLHRQQPPSPSSAPASLPLYQLSHVKPPIHHRRSSIDSHSHLPTSLLQHLNQMPHCGLQSGGPSVFDTRSATTAHASADSSSAGSSSKATASFSAQISNDRAEEANIASQSYSLPSAFDSSSSPFPCLSRKRRMPASECFSGVLDHSQTNDYCSFMSDVNGSTANCAVFPGNDKCSSTQTTLDRLLAAAAFYDDSPTSLSSHSAAIYASLLPPASHIAAQNNAASNFPFLSARRSDTEIGSSLQGIQADINVIQADVPERLKTAPAADPKAYMEQLPQLQARRSNALDATLVSSDFKVAQSDHSMFTRNASVEDEMMEIFRRSGTKTMNCLSPSESNNIIRNSSSLPIINGSNTSKTNNNSNNLVSATALYNSESAQEMQKAQQHKQILSFDWALKHALL